MESICFPCKLLIFHQKTEPAAKNPETFGGWQFRLKMFVFSSLGPKIVQFAAEIFQNLVVWKQNNGFGRGMYFVQKVKIFPGGKNKHVLTSWIDDLFVKTRCDMVRNARLIAGDCSVFPKFHIWYSKKNVYYLILCTQKAEIFQRSLENVDASIPISFQNWASKFLGSFKNFRHWLLHIYPGITESTVKVVHLHALRSGLGIQTPRMEQQGDPQRHKHRYTRNGHFPNLGANSEWHLQGLAAAEVGEDCELQWGLELVHVTSSLAREEPGTLGDKIRLLVCSWGSVCTAPYAGIRIKSFLWVHSHLCFFFEWPSKWACH